MKTVLIVDDDRSFLLSLTEGLEPFTDQFSPIVALNGSEAVSVLGKEKVDLVVTDLKMPVMDGFQLLAWLSKNKPHIPVIVMTAYCTPEIKERVEKLGSFRVLEKPIDFMELVDSIISGIAETSKGFIKGITLPAFLQLVEMEKKSCTLTIRSLGRTGRLVFSDGILVNADNGGGSRGEEAAYDIVCWEDAEIEIVSSLRGKERNVSVPLGQVIMEGFRRRDELERDIASAGQTGEDIAEAISLDELMDAKQDTAHALGTSYTQENKKEEKMAELREVLNEFTKLQGVDAVCLVGRDGFVLDRIAKTGIDTDMIGAIASSGFGSAESMGKQLGKGMMAISMIEYERGPVLFSPVGDDAFVVIVADREANLGMIRLKLKKHSQELQLAAAI